MKSTIRRVSLAIVLLSFCVLLSWIAFSKFGPRTDIQAYCLSALALLLATFAAGALKPLRDSVGIRIFHVFTICIAAFLAFELIGGLIWFSLDKLERHLQHR